MVLTILGTVLSGVFVFILGQLFIEYVLHPIQKYKALKSKIAYLLVSMGIFILIQRGGIHATKSMMKHPRN